MKKIVFITILILVFAAQWAIPLKMIYNNEQAIVAGKLFKFKTQPIDPSDPLRGAYITLNFEMSSIETKDLNWDYGERVFVQIKEDSLGFAQAISASKSRPQTNDDYLMVKVNNYYHGTLHFEVPFNRFYMEETKALDAEIAYIKAQRDSVPNNAYGLVYVKEGNAVLSDVIVNGYSVSKLNE